MDANGQLKEQYRVAKQQAVSQAVARIQQSTTLAVDTLNAVMENKKAPAMARVMAAKTVLEMAFKAFEVEDIAARLEAQENDIKWGKTRMQSLDKRIKALENKIHSSNSDYCVVFAWTDDIANDWIEGEDRFKNESAAKFKPHTCAGIAEKLAGKARNLKELRDAMQRYGVGRDPSCTGSQYIARHDGCQPSSQKCTSGGHII